MYQYLGCMWLKKNIKACVVNIYVQGYNNGNDCIPPVSGDHGEHPKPTKMTTKI